LDAGSRQQIKEVRMPGPDSEQSWLGESLERGIEGLRSLRPLPPADEMLIEDLGEEEDLLFTAFALEHDPEGRQ
jgi:hypothetical protein